MNKLLQQSLDSGRDVLINWQRELTARPALGPDVGGEGEAAKATWLLEELRNMGITDLTEYPAKDPRVPAGYRPNICARIPGKSSKTLWLISHLDIVSPGDPNLWSTPPYELHVDGDYIIGRGVEDNQQGMVTGMLVAKALIDSKITPDLTLALLFVADEETGMTMGLPHILKENPSLIAPEDIVLVPDMGNSKGTFVEIAEKSVLWLKFTVLGQQCHASAPDKGINSLVATAETIVALQELYHTFPKQNALFTPAWSTFVPSKKEANVDSINVLPGKDVFYMDCRVLPDYTMQAVEAECLRIAAAVAARTKATISVEVVHQAPALAQTSAESPQVERLVKSLRAVRGLEPELKGAGGQTEASILRNMGLSAVVWSTLVPNAHIPNERSSISNTILDAKVVADMLFD